jgi:hypothetical protein
MHCRFRPSAVSKAADAIVSGVVMGLKLQPYEAHIPYLLQFKIDMNIYGMGHLVCRAVHFRRDPPKDTPPQMSPGWNHVKSPVMRMHGHQPGTPVEVCLLSCIIKIVSSLFAQRPLNMLLLNEIWFVFAGKATHVCIDGTQKLAFCLRQMLTVIHIHLMLTINFSDAILCHVQHCCLSQGAHFSLNSLSGS